MDGTIGSLKEMLAQRTRHLRDQCGRIGRKPEQIVKSWAGSISNLFGSRKHADIVEEIRRLLRSATDYETAYFIALFGSRTESSNLMAFAEAVKSLI
jgi:hypothetical protein